MVFVWLKKPLDEDDPIEIEWDGQVALLLSCTEAAIIYKVLQDKYHEDVQLGKTFEMNGSEGWFCASIDYVRQETRIPRHAQNGYINILIEYKVIEKTSLWLKARRCFRLLYPEFLERPVFPEES